jgi:hypothetical protein
MKKSFIRTRKMRYGGITVVLTVLVIAVTVLANAVFGTLANRYLWFSDMNPDYPFDISDTCYALLDNFFAKEDVQGKKVEIIFCEVEENIPNEMTLRFLHANATALEQRYPQYLSVKCHDIWNNPMPLRKYTTVTDAYTGETTDILLSSSNVIVTCGDYFRVYSMEEFFVFEDGDSSKVWAYNGERKLAAAMMRALDSSPRIACMTNNHGEAFFDNELLFLLDDAGYSLAHVDLTVDTIPENCDLIVSYNPATDLLDDDVAVTSETAILEEFLSKEGNTFLVFLGNSAAALPNYEAFLASWGVATSYHTDAEGGSSFRYMVRDTEHSLTSDGYTIYGAPVLTGHSAELLRGMEEERVVFKNATALEAAQGYLNNEDGSYRSVKHDRVMYSVYEGGAGATSWANGSMVSNKKPILMTLTEQKNAGGTSYVGVISSVDFAKEDMMQSAVYGNSELLLQLASVTGGAYVPQGLMLKPFASSDITTMTTAEMVRWTVLLSVIPAVVVTTAGVVVLVKRRRA